MFCGRFDIEKGMTVLFIMDIVGVLLYAGNLAGVILGFEGGAQGFYLASLVDIPFVTTLNNIIVLHSSLIIAAVSIPRMFSFWFIKDAPTEYYRRQAYFIIRAVTCALLLAGQIAAFTAMIYYVVQYYRGGQQLLDEDKSLLNKRLIPFITVYGIALFGSIALDSYWVVQAFHYFKDGE